jgi:nicotinamide riboside kinase
VKVAFIGTHGVGKTTLCYELAALLKKQGLDVEVVMEVARSCPLPINRETSLKAQLWILHTQIAKELEVEARHAVTVCDRSVLDNYAYLYHAAGPNAAAERIVDDWISTYSLLLRVPRTGVPSSDGVRDTDHDFQVAIDERLAELLTRKRVPYRDLAGVPRNRWINSAVSAVLSVRRGESAADSATSTGPASDPSQLALFTPKVPRS